MAAHILVVDDNPQGLELMSYLLRKGGHEVRQARNGVDALAQIRSDRPGLVVMDVQMPKMDGYEVARIIKGDRELRRVPLVAVTAFAMVGDREKVMSSGFDGYLTKPIAPESFLTQIETHLPQDQRMGAILSVVVRTDIPVRVGYQATSLCRVLIVDDEPANIAYVRAVLQATRYEVVEARSIHQALVETGRAHPDLVISDIDLLDGTGYELLTKIHAIPALRDVPVILTTSSTRVADARSLAIQLGAAALVACPVEPALFLLQIEACLLRGSSEAS